MNRCPAFSLCLAALLAGVGLAGCNTTAVSVRSERIAAHPAAFATLSAGTQQQVREGRVEREQTFEAIYLILGTPDRVETSADGGDTRWLYQKFYHEVTVLGAPLFPSRSARDPNAKPRADPMNKLLLRGSAQTRDEYAQVNALGGYEMPKPAREMPDGGGPMLPGAELEVFFQNGKVTDVKVTRDVLLPPSRPVTAR